MRLHKDFPPEGMGFGDLYQNSFFPRFLYIAMVKCSEQECFRLRRKENHILGKRGNPYGAQT
jgi:hypothetical protein